jgi:hypothetical protein
MEILKDILDDDEKILLIKELSRRNLTPFYIDKKGKKQKSKKRIIKYYEVMKMYRSDEILKDYPIINVLTNKHIIRHDINRGKYPLWFKVNISHIFEYRKEFCVFNLNELNEICKNINPKKEKYELGLYFNLYEHNLVGDDAPKVWFNNLTKIEYKEVLEFLSKIAPNVKISFLFSKQKNLEID